MKRSKPPALATWVLEHSTADEALAGDLLEEFQARGSASWYWRQVLMAVVAGTVSDVRRHSLLALRAILMTWSVNVGALLLGPKLLQYFFPEPVHGPAVLFALWAVCFLGGMASGLLVAILHRKHQNAMLLTSAVALLGWALIGVVLLKQRALSHSFLEIAAATIVYYLVALIGFAIGGFFAVATRSGEPPRDHVSPVH
jgi:hypothetical protein